MLTPSASRTIGCFGTSAERASGSLADGLPVDRARLADEAHVALGADGGRDLGGCAAFLCSDLADEARLPGAHGDVNAVSGEPVFDWSNETCISVFANPPAASASTIGCP